MGRNRLYDKDEVLQKALELFWDRGYHATGMNELERTMGINKFGIYASFGSKRGLLLAAADRFVEVYQRPMLESIDPSTPRLSVLGFFDKVLGIRSVTGHGGCFLLMLGSEFNHGEPEIQARIASLYGEFEARMRTCLDAARSDGTLAVAEPSASLASFLRTLLEGILSRSRHGAGEETREGLRVLEHLFKQP